ncbi:MAG: glycoside hydrolase family 2, partial [Bacteroidetes bacterium]|nr:glycoside hydrolase family 2 [Bacteroidota bacterium]
MKFRCIRIYLTFLFAIFSLIQVTAQSLTSRENLFDFGWRFHAGGAQGAENPAFDDSKWRMIDLPHDWSLEDLPGSNSPFSINAISQVNGGFTTGGTGWYRKKFTLSENLKGKTLKILFEGVYMNSEVWLNGSHLGTYPYGYSSFWFDVTDNIDLTGENVLCVKVRNEGENSRWYSGSGIYRHVWLQIVSPVHIDTWGVFITTPQVSENEALVKINTTIINGSGVAGKIKLVTRIFDANSREITKAETTETIETGKTDVLNQEFKLNRPLLWSPDSPQLYRAVSEIYENETLVDQTNTKFGLRSISVDAVNCFLLNGKAMKLKGGCVHHDNGPLGSRAFDRAEERRIELLKASGFNAVRCSHNPPSPAFLDACDRLGMLVIDEAFDMWN